MNLYNNLIYIVIIIISLYLLIKNKEEHFTDVPTTDNIINQYKLDIPSTRNLAQLANKAFSPIPNSDRYKLYLPINKLIFGKQLNVLNDCNINNKTNINKGISYTNKNNIQNYNIFPPRTILAWGNNLNMLPPEWKLCDGTIYAIENNKFVIYNKDIHTTQYPTPDMKDRFILNEYSLDKTINPNDIINNRVPISRDYPFDANGGSNSVLLEKKHIPPHTHYFQLAVNDKKYTYTERQINGNVVYKADGSANDTSNINPTTLKNLQQYYKDLYLNESAISYKNTNATNTSVPSGYCQLNVMDSTPPNYVKNDNSGFNMKTTTELHNNIPPYTTLYYVIKLI